MKHLKRIFQLISDVEKLDVLSVLPYHGEDGKTLKTIVEALYYRYNSKRVHNILQRLNKKPHKYAICWAHTKRWRQTKLGNEFLLKNRPS